MPASKQNERTIRLKPKTWAHIRDFYSVIAHLSVTFAAVTSKGSPLPNAVVFANTVQF